MSGTGARYAYDPRVRPGEKAARSRQLRPPCQPTQLLPRRLGRAQTALATRRIISALETIISPAA